MNVMLELVRYIVRTNLQETFKPEAQASQNNFDLAFAVCYSNMKRHRITLQTFGKLDSGIAVLVLDAKLVIQILQCSTTWSSVADALRRAVSGSIIGERTFGFALQDVLTEKVSSTIDDQMKELHGADVDEPFLRKFLV